MLLKLHKKTSYRKKRKPTKNILDSLFTTHRENETTWETRKGSVKHTHCLVIFLNNPYSNQQHCCVQMPSSAFVCVLQIPCDCYITAYDEFLFRSALYNYLLCQQSQRLHLLQSRKKAGTVCQSFSS